MLAVIAEWEPKWVIARAKGAVGERLACLLDQLGVEMDELIAECRACGERELEKGGVPIGLAEAWWLANRTEWVRIARMPSTDPEGVMPGEIPF